MIGALEHFWVGEAYGLVSMLLCRFGDKRKKALSLFCGLYCTNYACIPRCTFEEFIALLIIFNKQYEPLPFINTKY